MMPDPAFIADRRDSLVGLVITHAHEDHLGAVAHLWRRLRCPIYATPFAAAVLRRKLGEAGLNGEAKITVVRPGGRFELPPFDLHFMPVTHSVPESQALVIRTPYGTILHTGDFKLDPDPLVGPATDEDAFRALGDEGVLAMVCDSTNAMVEGHSGSEGGRADQPGRVDPPDARPGGGHLLRQQRGAGGKYRDGRPGCRALGGVGRPLAAQPGGGGAGLRLPARPAGIRAGGGRDRGAGRQPADPRDGQPGRGAQRAGPHRQRHPPQHRAGRGRHGGVLFPDDPRQRAGDRHGAGQPGPPRRPPDDGRRPHDPRLRPPGARRAAAPVLAGAAELLRAGARRVAASVGPCGAWPRSRAQPRS